MKTAVTFVRIEINISYATPHAPKPETAPSRKLNRNKLRSSSYHTRTVLYNSATQQTTINLKSQLLRPLEDCRSTLLPLAIFMILKMMSHTFNLCESNSVLILIPCILL